MPRFTPLTEDAAIVAIIVFAVVGWLSSRRHATFVRHLLVGAVGIGLLGWCVLLISVFGSSDELRAAHSVIGQLMLPVVASATGLWLGAFFRKVVQHPIRILARMAILLLLCFCCFSNARTGYLGPSRVDPVIDPATTTRFDIVHQVAFPAFIGVVLVLWFRRLLLAQAVGWPNE